MNDRIVKIAAAMLAATFAGTVHAREKNVKEQLGSVEFQVSCVPEAQTKFRRAMALYHSFDWNRGRAAFNEIAQLDPRCGMAYWGLAMVYSDNPFGWPLSLKLKEGPEAIQKASETGAATQRERDYIGALAALFKDHANTPHRPRALAYEQAMENLAAKYPEDVEAKILYALAVSANHELTDKTYARPLKAAGILDPLFASHAQHPGVAHYLIHSYDYPPIAAKGIEAAKRYARVAADASHAQHMPSHIFTRVGFWRESVASNLESAKAARGDMRFIPHGWDYMVYAYLQLAEDEKADRVGSEARGAKLQTPPAFGEVFGVTAIPARLALERGRWAEAARLEMPPALARGDWDRMPHAESLNAFARGLGAARSGDASGARKEIERLRGLHAKLTAMKVGYWAEQTEIQATIVTAWALRAEGKNDEALAAMRVAADREDASEKHVVVPGPMIPARELLGDLLMEVDKPAEALTQYEASIGKEPNRFRGLYGAALAGERSGDKARARVHYEKLASVTQGSDGARPELARTRQVLASK